MKLPLCALAIGLLTLQASAQVVLDPPAKVFELGKSQVTCFAIAPKGDRILVGTDKGAELRDLETGKRLVEFPYNEDGSTTVYHGAFNDNGEYVVLIGFAGTREVWDVKTGKQDKRLNMYKWIPDAIRTRDLGLKKGNSNFDRFYQQGKAEHGDVAAHADKEGSVVFTDASGNALQTLTFPENKDKLYRAPCLFHDDKFITGTDNGRVLFYDLAKP